MLKQLIRRVAGRHEGDPAYAWTYTICSVAYLLAAYLFATVYMEGGEFDNIVFSLLNAGMCAFLFFCATVEKTRCRENGEIDYFTKEDDG